jgi:23S rRNA (uracil1939-C5)-methyltransferase
MEHALYYDFKQKMAEEAVRKAGFGTDCVKTIVTFPADSRRRVDLKVKNGAIGFHAGRSHTIVDMEECKVMEPALFDVVMRIKNQLSGLPDVTALQINGVDNGYDIAVDGKGDISVDVPEIRRLSVREGAGFRTVCRKGAVTLALGDITVDVPPGAFLQASHAAQVWMTHLVIEAVKTAGNVLDLFAGIGTYAFPVSESASVTAVEGDKAMVEAMRDAAKKHVPGRKFRAQRRDLFSSPLDAGELAGFEAVIINPPRAGAKAQAMQLAVSRVKKIVMVSCNPATFTRDARILREGGYRLHDVIPVDQFAYSPHLELVAEFMRG